ncbi:hypothetical protein BT67DRAFT_112433 [Trichocladium antarcticum]|uniref:Uncharacterized protein n=1 Tax=Trichocladium antarcticum TaxID=1450529 RepID=A0AAN6UTC6_9PEZI|nr:hypothetical protein BT67DRAFT_112433 [Trichocladium antarcticum]
MLSLRGIWRRKRRMFGVIWVMSEIVTVCRDCRGEFGFLVGLFLFGLFRGCVGERAIPDPEAPWRSVRCGFLCACCGPGS